jgi:hypothetical protein
VKFKNDLDECDNGYNGGCEHSCVSDTEPLSAAFAFMPTLRHTCECDDGFKLKQPSMPGGERCCFEDCAEGLEAAEDWSRCVDIKECARDDTNKCNKATSVCKELRGSYECECIDGYKGVGGFVRDDGKHVVPRDGKCLGPPLNMQLTSTKDTLHLNLDISPNNWDKYKVNLKRYNPSKTVTTQLDGWPLEFAPPNHTDIQMQGLPSGGDSSWKCKGSAGVTWMSTAWSRTLRRRGVAVTSTLSTALIQKVLPRVCPSHRIWAKSI